MPQYICIISFLMMLESKIIVPLCPCKLQSGCLSLEQWIVPCWAAFQLMSTILHGPLLLFGVDLHCSCHSLQCSSLGDNDFPSKAVWLVHGPIMDTPVVLFVLLWFYNVKQQGTEVGVKLHLLVHLQLIPVNQLTEWLVNPLELWNYQLEPKWLAGVI